MLELTEEKQTRNLVSTGPIPLLKDTETAFLLPEPLLNSITSNNEQIALHGILLRSSIGGGNATNSDDHGSDDNMGSHIGPEGTRKTVRIFAPDNQSDELIN